jgi:hypothetical protein
LAIAVEPVIEQAEAVNGSVSIKDSLVTPRRLQELASVIRNRVKWSACTKLHPRLADVALLQYLQSQGLATLEVGLESLLIHTQQRISKVHPPGLLEDFLHCASQVSGLAVVCNYITGFPWEDPQESKREYERAKRLVKYYLNERGKLEHNTFELERQSPMARNPERFDLDKVRLKFWPCKYFVASWLFYEILLYN